MDTTPPPLSSVPPPVGPRARLADGADDESHLRALAIAHYVCAGLTALCALFALIYVGMGLFMALAPESFDNGRAGEPPPAFLGWFFVFFGGVFLLMGEALALCLFLSGRWLSKGRRYWFSFVVACIACTIMPFGTVLGVFTIFVLSRDSVKRRYGLLRPTL